jgi:hypothetical protein
MSESMVVSKTDVRYEWRWIQIQAESSLFAGLTFISHLTLTLCLLFGKLLRTLLSGGDTGDDVAERVFQNFDGSYGGRTIFALLDETRWHTIDTLNRSLVWPKL